MEKVDGCSLKTPVVSDSGPIIGFSRINRITIFNDIFDVVFIPEAVRCEILRGGNRTGASEIKEYGWFKTAKAANVEAVRKLNRIIGLGESEAIILADEMALPLLCDDELARRTAIQMGYQNIIGTCSLLEAAKKLGLIKEIAPVFNELTLAGYWLSKDLMRDTLMNVKEI